MKARILGLAGGICWLIVVLTHVAERLHVMPGMGWGLPNSPGALSRSRQRRHRDAAGAAGAYRESYHEPRSYLRAADAAPARNHGFTIMGVVGRPYWHKN